MRKIDKEMPYANRKLLELVDSQANGRVQKFAGLVGLSQQRINRLFNRDTRNGQYPRMTDEIKEVVSDHFNLPWDYFTEPLDESAFEQPQGSDNITDKPKFDLDDIITSGIENLSKEELVLLVKDLIYLHNRQTESYKLLIARMIK